MEVVRRREICHFIGCPLPQVKIRVPLPNKFPTMHFPCVDTGLPGFRRFFLNSTTLILACRLIQLFLAQRTSSREFPLCWFWVAGIPTWPTLHGFLLRLYDINTGLPMNSFPTYVFTRLAVFWVGGSPVFHFTVQRGPLSAFFKSSFFFSTRRWPFTYGWRPTTPNGPIS